MKKLKYTKNFIINEITRLSSVEFVDVIADFEYCTSKDTFSVVLVTSEGYKYAKKISTVIQNIQKNRTMAKFSPFLDGVYGVDNFKLWLSRNRPTMTIVDCPQKLTWDTYLKVYDSNWDEEHDMLLKNIYNMKSPKATFYSKQGEKINEVQFQRNIDKYMKNSCYMGWRLLSDYSDYINNTTRMLFKNKEGYLAARKFCDLKLNTELIIFNSHTPELAMLNIKRYLEIHYPHITLIEGQTFSKKLANFKFKCKYHGEFESSWNNFYNRKQNCPLCREQSISKGEDFINAFLIELGYNFKRQYTFRDLLSKNNKRLKFDFAIFKDGCLVGLIEFQGQQHYKEFGGYFEGQLKEIQERDRLKKEYCRKNNIPLLILKYDNKDLKRSIKSFYKRITIN